MLHHRPLSPFEAFASEREPLGKMVGGFHSRGDDAIGSVLVVGGARCHGVGVVHRLRRRPQHLIAMLSIAHEGHEGGATVLGREGDACVCLEGRLHEAGPWRLLECGAAVGAVEEVLARPQRVERDERVDARGDRVGDGDARGTEGSSCAT